MKIHLLHFQANCKISEFEYKRDLLMAVEDSEQLEAKVIQKKPVDIVSAIILLASGIVVTHESLKLMY